MEERAPVSAVGAAALGLSVAPLGKCGINVSRFILGCAPVAGLYSPVDAANSAATLETAWQGGVRSFDTAPHYGAGLSEVRVGEFLRSKPRSSFVLSTKVGRLLVPGGDAKTPGAVEEGNLESVFDYSRAGVLASLEQSLGRLGLNRVDIALIHDPDDHAAEALDGAYLALEELRSAGIVRAIGVGMNQCDLPEQFVRDTDVDCVLVAGRYTLLDDRAGSSLLSVAASKGVAILAAGVFNSGLLADPVAGAPFDYRPAPPQLLRRAQAIQEVAERHGVPIAAAALQFPLRHEAVTAVVVGTRSAEETLADLRNFALPVPDAMWEELEHAGLLGWQTD